MKKLVVVTLVMAIISSISTLVCLIKFSKYVEVSKVNKCVVDTTINKVRIDSIQLVIKTKDSIITKIKEHEEQEIKEAASLNDSSAIELFKELVSD